MIAPAGEVITDKWGNAFMPLSVKGVVFEEGKIWLRKNEFGRWELPGGRVDRGEQPSQTVVREISEELGISVYNPQLVDVAVWKKDFGNNPIICIITFVADFAARTGELEHEGEAGKAEFAQYTPEEALALEDLPDVYKQAIQKAITYADHRH